MTLAAGTKLGRYEIRSKIGAGGIGEVHLACDMQLGCDRTVEEMTDTKKGGSHEIDQEKRTGRSCVSSGFDAAYSLRYCGADIYFLCF